jgi:Zn-dependent membrane protease YugP
MIFWCIVIFLPGALAALFTQLTFSKYSKVRSASGMTGAEAANRLLSSQGIHDVTIEPVQGFLSDHYDPTSKTLRLSPGVYQSDSLSAIGVACHEAGHALQHAAGYGPLALRTMLVPAASIGSYGSYILLLIGAFMVKIALIKLGLLLFSATVLFTLVTLPVEWNASARAKELMTATGIVTADEQEKAGSVLNAAFMTYVAAAFTSLMTLLYYLMRFGLIGGRRN